MKLNRPAEYAKAITGAITAVGTAFAAAVSDGSVTGLEWGGVAGAAALGFLGVYAVGNARGADEIEAIAAAVLQRIGGLLVPAQITTYPRPLPTTARGAGVLDVEALAARAAERGDVKTGETRPPSSAGPYRGR